MCFTRDLTILVRDLDVSSLYTHIRGARDILGARDLNLGRTSSE